MKKKTQKPMILDRLLLKLFRVWSIPFFVLGDQGKWGELGDLHFSTFYCLFVFYDHAIISFITDIHQQDIWIQGCNFWSESRHSSYNRTPRAEPRKFVRISLTYNLLELILVFTINNIWRKFVSEQVDWKLSAHLFESIIFCEWTRICRNYFLPKKTT